MLREVRLFDALDEFAAGSGIRHALALTYGYDGDIAHERIWRPLVEKYGVAHPLVVADGTGANVTSGNALGVTVVRPARSGRGVFHPKLLLAIKEDGVLVALGSANLTSGGLGGNLELVTALRFERGRTPPAPRKVLLDVLDFLRVQIRGALVKTTSPSTVDVLDKILQYADVAAEGVPNGTGALDVSFVHSGDRPIWDAVIQRHAEDALEHLLVVSPFFEREDPDDDASGLLIPVVENESIWAKSAPSPRVTLYMGTVEGGVCQPPTRALGTHPTDIALHTQLFSVEPRRLHGKIVVAVGKRRATILWGSPNFTPSALLRRWTPTSDPGPDGGGNAECALLLSVSRTAVEVEDLRRHYGLDDTFAPHAGPLPKAMPIPQPPPLPPLDVGEVLYDPETKMLTLHAYVLASGVRRVELVLKGISGTKTAVEVSTRGPFTGSWEAHWLEETDEKTGRPRLRTHDVLIRAYGEDGALLVEIHQRVNVKFNDALEVYQNLLLGPGAVGADALLVPTSVPPERRVAALEGYLAKLREARASGGSLVRHQASLDVFYRNVRRGLDARWKILAASKASKFALLRWSSDLRRALAAATVDTLDGPRRAFLVHRTSEHVAKVLEAIPAWQPDLDMRAVLSPAEFVEALSNVSLEDAALDAILLDVRAIRDRVIARLQQELAS